MSRNGLLASTATARNGRPALRSKPDLLSPHMGLGTVSAGAQANSLVVTFARDAAICGTASSCCCHYRPLRA
ncbi:hypothetical protein HBI67_180050 [Parastagonospora nodorum]|nr:hypothetical protein HBI47_139680 [Parastagonospora nodorum]KAH6057589.1 hypothetical protein HBI67_180050 [Parastagonospora nodorum]